MSKRKYRKRKVLPLIVILHRRGLIPHKLVSFFLSNSLYQSLKHSCKTLVAHPMFKFSIVSAIVFNIVVLAMEANGVSGTRAQFTLYSNLVCTVIFTLEILVQLVALDITTFFQNSFNILDLVIVLASLIELAFLKSAASLSIFRTLRVFRTFKLLKRWKSLQHLLRAVTDSGAGLGNFCVQFDD